MDPLNTDKGRPHTPPPPPRTGRLSQHFLTTPEQPKLNLPFSPGVKRSSIYEQALPDHILETPRYTEDNEAKKLKTPQYFQAAKKLQFDEDSDSLLEISSKLKNKLSSALNNLPEKEQKFTFTDITFTQSPTKSTQRPASWTPNKSLQTANLNLQTLEQSPKKATGLQNPFENRLPSSQSVPANLRIDIPTPKDDSSAHDALLQAISRQMKKKRSSFSHKRSGLGEFGDFKPRKPSVDLKLNRFSLPPLNVALNEDKNNEQDAVLSLMSLSSPQAMKFGHSRNHSYSNSNSNCDSPTKPTLPPISGIISQLEREEDDDATDIDVDEEDD